MRIAENCRFCHLFPLLPLWTIKVSQRKYIEKASSKFISIVTKHRKAYCLGVLPLIKILPRPPYGDAREKLRMRKECMVITDTQLHSSAYERCFIKNEWPVPSLWRCTENTYSDPFAVVHLPSPSPFLLHVLLAHAYGLNRRWQLVRTMAGGTWGPRLRVRYMCMSICFVEGLNLSHK